MIAILAVLFAILSPAVRRAGELARRVTCASNLHELGLGHGTYAVDNRMRIMRTATNSHDGVHVVPIRTWLDEVRDGEFNARALAPYVQGLDVNDKELGGVFRCPCNGDLLLESIADHWQDYSWIDGWYSYFAGADTWRPGLATRPQDLTGSWLNGDRLLMADTVFRWWVNAGWNYNHGRRGGSLAWTLQGDVGDSPAGVEGLNQLYADGAVRWRDLVPDEVRRGSDDVGQVIFYGVDYFFYAINK